MKIFMGGDMEKSTVKKSLSLKVYGVNSISAVLENFAANILDGTPLIAPGSDGINGVALANAIHLSSWLGKEVELPVDEEVILG